jgi:hypothetical protein
VLGEGGKEEVSKNYMYVSPNPVENLFHNILYHAENFEMRTGYKPTIFITPDLFNSLAVNYKHDLISFTCAKDEPNTFCGYPIEQIRSNKSGVSIGYKILDEELIEEER